MLRVDEARQPALDNLLAIAEIARDLNDFRPLGETMSLVCQRVAGMPACEWVTISLLTPDGSRTTAWGDSNIRPEFMDWARGQNPEQKSMRSPVFHAVASGRPVLISDISERTDLPALAEGARIQGARALAYIPIMARGRVLGTLNCYDSQPHDHSDAQVDLLQTVARLVGIAAETALIADHQKQTATELQALTDELADRNRQLSAMSEAQYRHAESLVDPAGDGLHSLCSELAEDLDASFLFLGPDLGPRAFAGDEADRAGMTRALARRDRARLPEAEVFGLGKYTVQRIGHGRTLGYIVASRRLPEHGIDAVLLKHAASLSRWSSRRSAPTGRCGTWRGRASCRCSRAGACRPRRPGTPRRWWGLIDKPARLALVRVATDVAGSAARFVAQSPAAGGGRRRGRGGGGHGAGARRGTGRRGAWGRGDVGDRSRWRASRGPVGCRDRWSIRDRSRRR